MSYFLFALIAVVIVIGGLLLDLTILGQGNMSNLIPSEMITENGELRDENVLYQLDGWAEKLDGEYRVLSVYGENAFEHVSYTSAELLALTGSDDNRTEYHVFYETVADGGFLFYIPANRLRVQYTYEATDKAADVMFICVLVLLVFEGVFISRYIYRKIKHPLFQLSDAMKRMENGERDIELSFRADGEFILLRDAFNQMINRLAAQEEENRALQQAQQNMILELSHDIRTPIATITACAAALEEGVVADEDVWKYYHTITSKAERVSVMADNMFTMLKMGNTEYQLVLQKIDLCELMRRISADYYNEAGQHELDMIIDIPDTAIYISADEALLQRAIGNLITNAIKYNRTGSIVGVAIQNIPDREIAVIHITDDGEAIDPAFIPQMFQPFTRADKARKTDGGTGLGLTIAKEIIEKHSGVIRYSYTEGRNDMEIELKCGFMKVMERQGDVIKTNFTLRA